MKAAGLMTLVGLASTSNGAAQPGRGRGRQRNDGALRRDNFAVEIAGESLSGWRSVTIPGSSTEVGEYREGNDPDYEKKLWGQTTFDDLEMERGVYPDDTTLYEWREAVRTGNLDEGRKELAVELQDRGGDPRIRWEFEGAWIKEYDPPELDASADGDVATESATIAYDKMKRKEV